jgi:hypothetical protein
MDDKTLSYYEKQLPDLITAKQSLNSSVAVVSEQQKAMSTEGCTEGGGEGGEEPAGLQHLSPSSPNWNLKTTHFVHIISNDLCELPSSWNQMLKLADDQYSTILNLGGLRQN